MIILNPRCGRRLWGVFLVIIASQIAALSYACAGDSPAVTLPEAIEKALLQRPELEASSKDVLAAQGRVVKSAAFPNPELEVEASSQGDEDSVAVSQPFELSRKRDARVKAAEAEIPLYKNNLWRMRLDIIDQVSLAFVSMLGAQEKLVLVTEAHDIAERFAGAVFERVAAGEISPIEEIRAKVLLGGAATDLAGARRELAEARLDLAAAMGETEGSFTSVEGRIPTEPIIPDKSTLLSAITASPDLAQWELDRVRRNAMVLSEKAARIPDITFLGKVSHDREIGETAYILGMSIPLPFFDRNRGGILEAGAELDKVPYSARSEELRVRSEIEKRFAVLQSLASEIGIVRDRMLFFANQAFDAVSEGYRLGKFQYLDVLDASNELTGAKLRHLELLISFELEKTAMNRLVAPAQTGWKENHHEK